MILVGYWAAFVLHPLPAADFNYAGVRVGTDWLRDHGVNGFAAHWQKNSNLAWAFDTWWLNLFPREKPFTANGGGYATLPLGAWQWVFVAPVFIAVGAGVAFATLDLDFGNGAMLYCFYLVVTLLLRFAIGWPPLWATGSPL